MTADGSHEAGDLLDRLRLSRGYLPARLRRIADAVINDPQEVAFGSTTKVARQLGMAPSALVRFGQACGYTGFSPFQRDLRAHLNRLPPGYQERVDSLDLGGADEHSDFKYVLDAFVSANVRALEAARTTTNADELHDFVVGLKSAATIGVVGNRRAFPLAAYLYYGLTRLDLKAMLLDGVGDMSAMTAPPLGRRDVLVAISFTPYAPGTIALIEAARQRGAKIFSITDFADGPVAGLSDCTLLVAESNLSDIRSIAVTSTIIQAIFVSLGLIRKDRGRRSANGEPGE